MRALPNGAAAQGRRLLRVLLVRLSQVPTGAGAALLHKLRLKTSTQPRGAAQGHDVAVIMAGLLPGLFGQEQHLQGHRNGHQ